MDIKPFNNAIKDLKNIIKTESGFRESIELALHLHSMVHLSKMSKTSEKTYEDNLWNGLEYETAKSAVNKKGRTIVYGIWHSTRIEDITSNILIGNRDQILDKKLIKKINSLIPDTGNQLSPQEILEFSKNIDIDELLSYRIKVGRNTRKILKSLEFRDLKRKFTRESLDFIFSQKAVSKHPDAQWLVDFWGKKNVAGIICMPLTRHQLIHINESNQAKSKGIKKQNKSL